eukprot:9463586-Pyramimonas_sp.AAC.1
MRDETSMKLQAIVQQLYSGDGREGASRPTTDDTRRPRASALLFYPVSTNSCGAQPQCQGVARKAAREASVR